MASQGVTLGRVAERPRGEAHAAQVAIDSEAMLPVRTFKLRVTRFRLDTLGAELGAGWLVVCWYRHTGLPGGAGSRMAV
jgi:hypothetical protein